MVHLSQPEFTWDLAHHVFGTTPWESEADGVSETLLHEFASRDVDALFEAVSWLACLDPPVVFVGFGRQVVFFFGGVGL